MIGLLLFGCGESPVDDLVEVPDVYKAIYGAEDMYVDGDFLVIQSKDLPDHKSPYYENTEWAATYYEAYNGSNPNFRLNPNRIQEQSMTFRIPLNPSATSNNQATGLGPIGISLNGVPFFNQYAGPNQPLTNEIDSFDQFNGHPQASGMFHYHIEPLHLTTEKGKNALLGFLLDGFPVYGPMENGVSVEENDLDEFHGHMGVTDEYPEGIYHYHITANDPYLNGNGYYGTPGTVSN